MLEAAPGSALLQWLSPDIGWVALSVSWVALAGRLRETPPIFCRHICPVHATVPLTQTAADVDLLVETAAGFTDDLAAEQPFSVQTRFLGEGWSVGPYDVNTPAAAALARGGAPLDVRNPVQVLSIVATPQMGYLGLSLAADNLSDWAGGARRFRQEKGQISRAEFKLLEALEVFDLDVAGARTALDLGAAPGGWTRVLRQRGVRVVAVDPAALDPRLEDDDGIRHVRQLAEDFLPSAEGIFDIIVNDIRMDARDSARLMGRAVEHLHPRGWGLITLKLPKRDFVSPLQTALEMLGRTYEIIGARQLFHNRSEVTVAVQRKESIAWPRS
ncbi:MAG: 50S rRNA methyltransferase [Anaerolineae bacterium]|nr:50S rRNA methyltransferase [Anaerolineae bacterium]